MVNGNQFFSCLFFKSFVIVNWEIVGRIGFEKGIRIDKNYWGKCIIIELWNVVI